jgi:AcrR family transcriptional regulator
MEQSKIEEIRKLKKEEVKVSEIAKRFGVTKSTIYYYVDEDFRKARLKNNVDWFKKLPLERRRFYYKRRLPYLVKYQRDHYQNDEVFRNKQRARNRKKN